MPFFNSIDSDVIARAIVANPWFGIVFGIIFLSGTVALARRLVIDIKEKQTGFIVLLEGALIFALNVLSLYLIFLGFILFKVYGIWINADTMGLYLIFWGIGVDVALMIIFVPEIVAFFVNCMDRFVSWIRRVKHGRRS